MNMFWRNFQPNSNKTALQHEMWVTRDCQTLILSLLFLSLITSHHILLRPSSAAPVKGYWEWFSWEEKNMWTKMQIAEQLQKSSQTAQVEPTTPKPKPTLKTNTTNHCQQWHLAVTFIGCDGSCCKSWSPSLAKTILTSWAFWVRGIFSRTVFFLTVSLVSGTPYIIHSLHVSCVLENFLFTSVTVKFR